MRKFIPVTVTLSDKHLDKLNRATKQGMGNRSQVVRRWIEDGLISTVAKPKKGKACQP